MYKRKKSKRVLKFAIRKLISFQVSLDGEHWVEYGWVNSVGDVHMDLELGNYGRYMRTLRYYGAT